MSFVTRYEAKMATEDQISFMRNYGIKSPEKRTFKEAEYFFKTRHIEKYSDMLIKVLYDMPQGKNWSITATTRNGAKYYHKKVVEMGGTNIRFIVFD